MNKYTPFAKTAPLLLFALLAVFLLYTVFSGAELYDSVNHKEGQNRTVRTTARYIDTRIAQAEEVTAGEFHGQSTLMLWESEDGLNFLTRIYCWDGYLRELFTIAASGNPDEDGFSPEDGEKLFPLADLTVAEGEGLLTVTLSDGEHSVTLYHNGGDIQ